MRVGGQAGTAKALQLRGRIEPGEYIFDRLKLAKALKGLGVAERQDDHTARKDRRRS